MAICLRPGLSPTTPVVPTILQHCTKQPIQHSDYSMLDSLQHWSTLFQKSVQNSQCLSHEGELQLHELQEFHGDQRSQRSQWFQSQRFQRSDLRHELFVEGWNLTGISWTGRAMKFYILGWNMIPIKKRTGSKPPFCCFIGAALSITLQRCQETIHLMTSFLSSRIASSHCLTDWHELFRISIYSCISGRWKSHDLITNPVSTGFVPVASPCIWGPFSVCLHCKTTKTLRHLNTNPLRLEVLVPLCQKTAALKATSTWFWFHRGNCYPSHLNRHRRPTPTRSRRKSWDHQWSLRSGSSTEKIVRIW